MRTASTPLHAVRTAGSIIELDDGRRLVDGVASWWTACHGYNHPAIRRAVAAQLERMPHVMLGGLVHEPVIALSDALAEVLPSELAHMFYSESGSVAVEVALKMAVQYWINRGQSQRRRFLAFKHGYHGDTFAAMSVCDPEEGMHRLFRGVCPPQIIAELPADTGELAALRALLDRTANELAAVIIEPLVQGAGGMRFHSPAVLAQIVALVREYGLLVIFDEIATGFGRTGTMFALDRAAVAPDILTLSKALTGGTLPLAVTVASRQVFDAFGGEDASSALMHGPTFSGNPLGCAAALASLGLFREQPRLAQVARIESDLRQGLHACAAMPGVVDVRVQGAIGVVQLAGRLNHDRLRRRFVELGVWVRPFGDIVYLTPAFTISPAELGQLIDAVVAVVGEWSSGRLA
jgi:adenosylmethionine-8-amino-7-oxononanoate aminotransferase